MHLVASFGVSASFALWLVADRAVHGRLDERIVVAALLSFVVGGLVSGSFARRRARTADRDIRTEALVGVATPMAFGAVLAIGGCAFEFFVRGAVGDPPTTQLAAAAVHVLGGALLAVTLATRSVLAAYTARLPLSFGPAGRRTQAS